MALNQGTQMGCEHMGGLKWCLAFSIVALISSSCSEPRKYHETSSGGAAAGGATGAPGGVSGSGGGSISVGSGGSLDGGTASGGKSGAPDGTGGQVTEGGTTGMEPNATGGASTGGSNPGAGGTKPEIGGANANVGTGGSGGVRSTGGAGGLRASGGTGTGGGNAGAGGSQSTACQNGTTRCSGSSLQTCSGNTWTIPVSCGAHQTCAGASGSAMCSCKSDSVCDALGPSCSGTSTLAMCMMDSQGCFYEAGSSPCANGVCNGPTGQASCCTNACTSGASMCDGNTVRACNVSASGCTDWMTSTCASGLLCERFPAPSCVDPNWAEWPIPNSSKEASAGAPNAEGYTDNGDNTVTDKVTGLMWQQQFVTSYNQSMAAAYCPTLTLGGHHDWRLPTVIELASLIDVGSIPTINTTAFPNTPGEIFWSSTVNVQSSDYAWYVDFNSGLTDGIFTTLQFNVRCVR